MLRTAMAYSDIYLLDYLKQKQGDDPEIKIRHNRIVADTGISLATVRRGLKRLERGGAITRERDGGFECTYKVMR